MCAVPESKRSSFPCYDKITYSMLQHLPKNSVKALFSLFELLDLWGKDSVPQS